MAREQLTLDHIKQFLNLLDTIVDGQIIRWNADDQVFEPSTMPAFGDVSTTSPVVVGNLPAYSLTTGRQITDSGVPVVETKILSYKSYVGTDPTTSSGTVVDADATNLAVTFTVPVSGKVLVRLTAMLTPDAGAAHPGAIASWGIREGTTPIFAPRPVGRDVGTGYTIYVAATAAFVVTGLTPGASKTYKWTHMVTASGVAVIGASSANGPAIMEVWALP